MNELNNEAIRLIQKAYRDGSADEKISELIFNNNDAKNYRITHIRAHWTARGNGILVQVTEWTESYLRGVKQVNKNNNRWGVQTIIDKIYTEKEFKQTFFPDGLSK